MGKKQVTMTAKNRAFWKLPKDKQAVAIAKDVLKQIQSKFLVASKGDYFQLRNIENEITFVPKKLDDAFLLLKNKGVSCDVCGIGSCFVSLIRLGDNFETKHVFGNTIESYDSISEYEMRPTLRMVFSPPQLSLIESAFEMCSMYDNKDSDAETPTYEAAKFGSRYNTDKGRLTGIMKNIIKNKGTFIP